MLNYKCRKFMAMAYMFFDGRRKTEDRRPKTEEVKGRRGEGVRREA
jgi:hypothetical protein